MRPSRYAIATSCASGLRFAAVESVTHRSRIRPAFQPSRWSGDKGYFQHVTRRADLNPVRAAESPQAALQSAYLVTIPARESAQSWFAMGEFSPTTRKGDCEEIANQSTAYGRRRRNWIDAHGSVPAEQVVDSSAATNTASR